MTRRAKRSDPGLARREVNGPTPAQWAALRAAAIAATEHAYAPYSQFRVGAAGLTDDGRIVSGCNVENASYGVTFCAEVTMVGQLRMLGARRLVAVVTVQGAGTPVMPCGRCRQILMEHGGPECLVNGDGTVRTMAELLPSAFTAEHLTAEHVAAEHVAAKQQRAADTQTMPGGKPP
jgi:cytidine deaminase